MVAYSESICDLILMTVAEDSMNTTVCICVCVLIFVFVFSACVAVPVYLAQHPQGLCIKIGTNILVKTYIEQHVQNVPARMPSKPLDSAAL